MGRWERLGMIAHAATASIFAVTGTAVVTPATNAKPAVTKPGLYLLRPFLLIWSLARRPYTRVVRIMPLVC